MGFSALIVRKTARVFIFILNKISKEQTLRYILTLIDDMLQVCCYFTSHWVLGRQITCWNLSWLLLQVKRITLVSFFRIFPKRGSFLYVPSFPDNCKVCMLVFPTYGGKWLDLLFKLATWTTDNNRKLLFTSESVRCTQYFALKLKLIFDFSARL